MKINRFIMQTKLIITSFWKRSRLGYGKGLSSVRVKHCEMRLPDFQIQHSKPLGHAYSSFYLT